MSTVVSAAILKVCYVAATMLDVYYVAAVWRCKLIFACKLLYGSFILQRCIGAVLVQSVQSKQDGLLRRLDELDHENDGLRSQVEELEDSRDQMQEQIQKLSDEKQQLVKQISDNEVSKWTLDWRVWNCDEKKFLCTS